MGWGVARTPRPCWLVPTSFAGPQCALIGGRAGVTAAFLRTAMHSYTQLHTAAQLYTATHSYTQLYTAVQLCTATQLYRYTAIQLHSVASVLKVAHTHTHIYTAIHSYTQLHRYTQLYTATQLHTAIHSYTQLSSAKSHIQTLSVPALHSELCFQLSHTHNTVSPKLAFITLHSKPSSVQLSHT